jgi:hypothetical protein
MNKGIRTLGLASLIALATVHLPVAAQQRTAPGSDQQVSDLIRRVDAGLTAFRASLDRRGRDNRVDGQGDLDRSLSELQETRRGSPW